MRPSDLIKKGWTQGAFARNAEGEALAADRDSEATCWCALGAIHTCFSREEDTLRYVTTLKEFIPESTVIIMWNDYPEQTQENVLNTLLKAEEKFYG